MKKLKQKTIGELEEAKDEFDTAIKNLSKLANRGFKFKIKVGPEGDSDLLISLADHESNGESKDI